MLRYTCCRIVAITEVKGNVKAKMKIRFRYQHNIFIIFQIAILFHLLISWSISWWSTCNSSACEIFSRGEQPRRSLFVLSRQIKIWWFSTLLDQEVSWFEIHDFFYRYEKLTSIFRLWDSLATSFFPKTFLFPFPSY